MRQPPSRLLLLVLVAGGCSDVVGVNHFPPPQLTVSATSRVVPTPGGAPALQVTANLHNRSTSPIAVGIGASCPLFVRIFPDSTGENVNAVDPSMGCPMGGSHLTLVPGDSALLVRMLPTDSLVSHPAGTYGINVAVTSSTGILGVWAGTVQLPLVAPY